MRFHRFAPLATLLVLLAAPILALLSAPDPGAAQTGVITGRVMEMAGKDIAGATVRAQLGVSATIVEAITDEAGRFRIAGLTPGVYAVEAELIGYRVTRYDGVEVAAGESAFLTIRLPVNPVQVTSLGVHVRGAQEFRDAPASIGIVRAEQIEKRPAMSPVDHVRSEAGVDVIRYGIQSYNIVTRGFNNLFSGALHTLTDYRLASVPSLRVNLLHLEPAANEDLEQMEIVLGPGAALYGPNTANGVLHILTRSPLEYTGTRVSFTTGERDVMLGSFRTAHRFGETFGVKLSGQYAEGREWEYTDPIEAAAREDAIGDPVTCQGTWTSGGVSVVEAQRRCSRVGERGFNIERFAFDARADWIMAEGWTTVFSAGASQSNGIELTGLGAAQAKDWTKYYGQIRTTRGRLFAQAYLNGSDAGRTYLLQNGASIIDNSKLFVAQIQHGFRLGERQNFTYGVDYLRTMPDTEGTINGAKEDDDLMTEVGAYAQSETALTSGLDLVLAGRIDEHSALEDPVFSPRAALVFTPKVGHTFRGTFNRAFETPTSLNLFLDIHGGAAPDPTLAFLGYGLRAQGPGTEGVDLVDANGWPLAMRSPFNPGGRGQMLPPDPGVLWTIGAGLLRAQGIIDDATYADFLALNASGVGINALDPNSLQIAPLGEAGLTDIPPISESRTTTWEVGYKGLIGQGFSLAADIWHTRKSNFISPLYTQTPFLMLDGPTMMQMLVPYFMGKGMPQAQAQATALQLVQGDPAEVGDGLAEIPLAVASSPAVNAVGSDMLVSYRNFGEVDLWGADIAAQLAISRLWNLGVNASYSSDDHFVVPLDGVDQIVALNAPKWKGSASLGYTDPASGFNAEARVRYHNEFPANSAGYAGLECVGVGTSACVESAYLTDLTFGYRLPMYDGASIQLAIQNVFDEKYRSFVRVPAIGRMALLRMTYEF